MSDSDTRELLAIPIANSTIVIRVYAPYPFTADGLRRAIEIADAVSCVTEKPVPEDEIQAARGGSDG